MANNSNATLPAIDINSLNEFLSYYDPNYSGNGLNHSEVTSITFNSSNADVQHAKYDDSIWVTPLVLALKQCGIYCRNDGSYDLEVSKAVKDFQQKHMQDQVKFGLCHYGVLNDLTIKTIIKYAKGECPDYIDLETGEFKGDNSSDEDDVEASPHYNTFFDETNSKQFRQNHRNIKIVFGNSGIIKEIHDVIMRGVGVEVDTSGNPISETYEFIARDLTETDESNDANKYNSAEGVASSDIQYKFNFARG